MPALLDPTVVQRWPFHELLPSLRRAVAANGQSHLVVHGRVHCGASGPVDSAWHGRQALELVTCPACRDEAKRILLCVEQEAAAIQRQAGPLTRLLVAHVSDERPLMSAAELARLEQRSYVTFWLSLVLALAVAACGLPAFAILWALGASLLRLCWTLGRLLIEREIAAASGD